MKFWGARKGHSGDLAQNLHRSSNRGRQLVGDRAALLLYALLALTILWPFRSVYYRGAGDLIVHLGGVVEAANALSEGQFPVRVAPMQNGATRYAIFQFYGNFPYTAAALIYLLPGLDPYQAWKIFSFWALVAGGWYVYRIGVRLSGQRGASMVSGVVFLTSPYFLTDLYVRGAFTELTAIMLLPGAFYYLLRTFAQRQWRYVGAAGIFWALLQLTHNITYLYGSCFFGLYFLCQLRWRSREPARILRLAAACSLHLLLVAWYVAPQFATLNDLDIAVSTASPFYSHVWTPLHVLLAPSLRVARGEVSILRDFGLQIGWPALAAAGLAATGLIYNLASGRRRRDGRRRALCGRAITILVLFALAFWLVWSPIDFWPYLPSVFRFIQFTYRNLAFTAFWGALALPCGAALLRRREAPPALLLAALLLAGAAVSAYLPAQGYVAAGEVLRIMTQPLLGYHPRTGGLADYAVSFSAASRTSASNYFMDLSSRGGSLTHDNYIAGRAQAALPAPAGAAILRLDGAIPPSAADGLLLRLEAGSASIEKRVAPGAFQLELPIPAEAGRKMATIAIAASGASDASTPTPIRVDRLMFLPNEDEDARTDDGVLVLPANEIAAPADARGRFRFSTPEPAIVQLPVLYYPKLLRVKLDGKVTSYQNVGAFVAVRVDSGRHRVEVRFVGLPWASVVSAVGWAGGVGMVGWGALRRRAKFPRRRVAWRMPAIAALVGFAAVQAGIAAPREFTHLMQKLALEFHYTAEASRALAPPWGVVNAFDHDATTAWVAPGAAPVTLDIHTNRPAILKRVVLQSRRTSLLEAWRSVRVDMFLRGQPIASRQYEMASADTEPVQTLDLPTMKADTFSLTFSSPVTKDLQGKSVSSEHVSPGYSEIGLEWGEGAK